MPPAGSLATSITKIWFAKPFLGFLYVVAEFNTGEIYLALRGEGLMMMKTSDGQSAVAWQQSDAIANSWIQATPPSLAQGDTYQANVTLSGAVASDTVDPAPVVTYAPASPLPIAEAPAPPAPNVEEPTPPPPPAHR